MICIVRADPGDPELRLMIQAQLDHGSDSAPAQSDHTFGVAELQQADIRFWAAYEEGIPLGCGALKPLGDGSAEVKSVHVIDQARGRGLARQIMEQLANAARKEGLDALVLETGSALCPGYDAARALYEKLGYNYCDPIPGYVQDPYSVFMRLGLDPVG